MAYSDFIDILDKLHIKKKGKRPKMSANRFYPARVDLQTQELIREELSHYAYKLHNAAQNGGVKAVYDVPGAVPEGFDEKVAKVANEVSMFQVRAFSNFSEMAVGERYFPQQGDKETILTTWTANFVNLCKSTNEEMRKKVAGVVSDGVLGGRNIRDLTKDIQNTCSEFTRNKAELIATTEVSKLNSAIARNQSESAGIQFYEWAAAMDGRTRESHAVMDGKICKWGDDTHYYVWSEPDPKTGKKKLIRKDRPENAYKGAPGTDFRCRCVALPYVPEFEDDYEAERENGPVRGVTQGKNADPETIKRNEEFKKIQKAKELKEARKARERKRKELAAQRAAIARKKASVKKRRSQTLDVVKALFKNAPAPVEKSDNFFVCPDREKEAKKGNKMSDFKKESEIGKIMGANGHPICLIPETEDKTANRKHPDAIMDGLKTEFKEVQGSRNKVGHRFLEAFHQAGTSVISVQSKDVKTVSDCINKIYGSAKKSFLDGHNIEYSSPYSWIILNGGKPKRINVGEIIERAKEAAKK